MEKAMKYTAYFIGGPIDGQERFLALDSQEVQVRDSSLTYRLLFAFGEKYVLVYSTLTLDEAMTKLWERYHESICSNNHEA
jgi:hypothetical protein